MSKIENMQQLRLEITRLRGEVKKQEAQVKNDLREVREELKPANLVWSALSSITGIKMNRNEFFKDGFAFGMSMLLQRFVLKTEKKVEHLIYEFIDSLVNRIKHYTDKFTNPEARRQEREDA